MQVKLNKHEALDLEPIPLKVSLHEGVRSFSPAPAGRSRDAAFDAIASMAANVVTRAVATTFAAPFNFELVRKKSHSEIQAERGPIGTPAAFRDPSGSIRVVYREITIRFGKSVAKDKREALLRKFNLETRKESRFHRDQIVVVDSTREHIAEGVIALANALTDTEEVEFAFPNFVSQFKRNALAAGPWHAEQWHLDKVNARAAWALIRKKPDRPVVVAVIDDGVDVDHPNLKRAIARGVDPRDPKDLCGRDFFIDDSFPDHYDPRPKNFNYPYDDTDTNDIHGTPCAGVIAATGSKNSVRGVAPGALILPVKIFHADRLADEFQVAESIRYATRFADIISASWSGPRSPDIDAAVVATAGGRGGKGVPAFFAAGNESATRVGHPARMAPAIAVGASTSEDGHASYSNSGPQISIVAPSDGGRLGIYTTDVSARGRGYNIGSAAAGGVDGLHTNDFGGTSSATPLAAGIAALMLQANPALTAADVRSILESTAVKIGAASSYNAAGHSNKLGHGRVDAAKAVAEAVRRIPPRGPAKKAPAKKK